MVLFGGRRALRERIPEVRFRGATTATTENNPADKTPANAGAREERGRLTRCESATRGFCPAKSWLKAGPKQTFTADGFEQLWNITVPRTNTFVARIFSFALVSVNY